MGCDCSQQQQNDLSYYIELFIYQFNITSVSFHDAYTDLLLSYNKKNYKEFYFSILSIFLSKEEISQFKKKCKLNFSLYNEEIDNNFIIQLKAQFPIKLKENILYIEYALLRNTSLCSKMAFFGLMSLIFGQGKIEAKVRITTLHIINFYGSDKSSYDNFFKDLNRIIIQYPSNANGYQYNNDQVYFMLSKLLNCLETTEIHYLNLFLTNINAVTKNINEQKREVLSLFFNQNNDLLTTSGFIKRISSLS